VFRGNFFSRELFWNPHFSHLQLELKAKRLIFSVAFFLCERSCSDIRDKSRDWHCASRPFCEIRTVQEVIEWPFHDRTTDISPFLSVAVCHQKDCNWRKCIAGLFWKMQTGLLSNAFAPN
jgi:hypothetical protein